MTTYAAITSTTTVLAGARLRVAVPMTAGAVSGIWQPVSASAIDAVFANTKCHSRRPEEVASQP